MNQEKEQSKALNKRLLLICCVGLLFLLPFLQFYETFGHYSNSNDYLFFYYQTKGECHPIYQERNTCGYLPVYLLITSPLPNETLFFLFNLILLIGVIPLILLKIHNSNWILLFYFFGISFIHNILYAGIFPQLLISIYFLLIIAYRRNLVLHSLLIGLGAFTHSFGFFFLGLVVLINWICNIINDIYRAPVKMETTYYPVTVILMSKPLILRLPDLVLKHIAFPFSLIAVKELIKRKEVFLFSLLFITFAGALFLTDRIILFSQLILIIPLSKYLPTTKRKFRLLTLFVLMEYALLSFLFWVLADLSLFLGRSLI